MKNIDYPETDKIVRIHKHHHIIVKYGLLVWSMYNIVIYHIPDCFGNQRVWKLYWIFRYNPINVICVVLLKCEHQKAYNV